MPTRISNIEDLKNFASQKMSAFGAWIKLLIKFCTSLNQKGRRTRRDLTGTKFGGRVRAIISS